MEIHSVEPARGGMASIPDGEMHAHHPAQFKRILSGHISANGALVVL